MCFLHSRELFTKTRGQSFNSLETCIANGGPVSPGSFSYRVLSTVQGAEASRVITRSVISGA